MIRIATPFMLVLALSTAWAGEEKAFDLEVGGEPWLRTVITPYDDSSRSARDATYKVYTHVYDFDGDGFLTKGAGGKYTHHRGLFIGWMKTLVGDREYDTWHMRGCYQRHAEWLSKDSGRDSASQSEVIEWCDDSGEPFIREVRSIRAGPGEAGMRVIDFRSELTSLSGAIQLRGDLQHAGMQIRLANEVSTHEDTTDYVLPADARELDDDEVVGAWWLLCSAEIGGKRYWFVHMTPPSHPLGVPVYSIRRYGRFGAFFEPDLTEGVPLTLDFRIVVSERELTGEQAARLYAAYSDAVGGAE